MADMTYRGYTLRVEPYKPPFGPAHDSIGVYADGVRVAPVANAALARRVIDTWIASGRWSDRGKDKN